MYSHLDSEDPSLPLWVQTIVPKIQQDLETRKWPTVEPIALDLCSANEKKKASFLVWI